MLNLKEKDVIKIIKQAGLELNPLYKMGFKRVGCMPCLIGGMREFWLCKQYFPERIKSLLELEQKLNSLGYNTTVIPYIKFAKYMKRVIGRFSMPLFEVDSNI